MRSSLLIEFIKSQHGSQLHKGIVRRKMHLKWLLTLCTYVYNPKYVGAKAAKTAETDKNKGDL